MNDVPYEEIIKELNKIGMIIADNVKTGAEISYPIVVRQVYVEAFKYFMGFILGIILLYASYRLVKYIFENCEDAERILSLFSIIPAFLGLVLVSGIVDAVAMLINPHWYAIKMIIEMIGK